MNLRRLEQKMHLEAEQKMRDDIALENSRRALQFSNQAEAMSKIRNARYTEWKFFSFQNCYFYLFIETDEKIKQQNNIFFGKHKFICKLAFLNFFRFLFLYFFF